MLEWLLPGSFTEKQDALVAVRVERTGEWFLQAEEFQEWVNGSECTLLFCSGIRWPKLVTFKLVLENRLLRIGPRYFSK